MALILLRHTRPEGAEGLCYGRTDLPLAADFGAEAARLARDLPPFTRILSSPLSRCLRLAEALAAARARPLMVDARLVEMDFGRWEGQRWAAIARAELDAWATDLTGARPHGGETVAELASRSARALTEAMAGPVPALVVCHAGVIKAALAARQGAQGWRAQPDYGSWLQLGAGWNIPEESPPDV
ncbi:MAG: histidine phosphatase family protein [Pararhodobacter sp.]|nr:histidine phosphatase family protein [Pararhodobacter sp.]